MMIDFGPIIEQVKPYLWIVMLFFTLAAMVKSPWFKKLFGKKSPEENNAGTDQS